MAGDFNHPVVTDGYTNVLAYVRDLCSDLAKGLDGTGTSNIPTNAIRWNSTNKRFEKCNGSSWDALESTYAINVDQVDGYHAGNSTGQVAVSNGTLCTTLNADLLDGVHSTAFAEAVHTHAQSAITDLVAALAAKLPLAGGIMTGDIDVDGNDIFLGPAGKLILERAYNGLSNGQCGLIVLEMYNNSGATIPFSCPVSAHRTYQDVCILSDADHAGAMPIIGIAAADIADASWGKVLLFGTMKNTGWSWTLGQTVYAGDTPGSLTQTVPTGDSARSQPIAFPLASNTLLVCPGFFASAIKTEAEAGTSNASAMTPLRTAQAIAALAWTSSNDGAGSGLDADLLDGLQGSAYSRLIYTSSAWTWTANTYWLHQTNLSSAKIFLVKLVCTSAEYGYAVGDVVYLPIHRDTWTAHVSASSGYLTVYTGANFKTLYWTGSATAEASLTPAKWSAYLLAFA